MLQFAVETNSWNCRDFHDKTVEDATVEKLDVPTDYKYVCNPKKISLERFTLGPGCLALDDATTICFMEKPKDLQCWSVLFQYPFKEQLIGLTFQVCTSCCLRDTLLKR